MTKSKSAGLSSLPREQRAAFLIGPVGSWFMPNTTHIWSQSATTDNEDCDGNSGATNYMSYFAYGSIGCFCLGEIHHQPGSDRVAALVTRMVDVKNDNSRVACIRFQRELRYPIVVALTESGSLLIYDCLQNETLLHLKKSEVFKKFIGPTSEDEQDNCGGSEHNTKRARFNVTQQLNSCTWPQPNNLFIGVSLLKEKTCFLLRLKLKCTGIASQDIIKEKLISGHQRIELNLKSYASPICLIDSIMVDENTCLITVAMDDGLITVISMNLEEDRVLRTIKLARHSDQICSMSFSTSNKRKFPLGLLASASRDGLTLIWDVENEFYFADYLAIQQADRGSGAKINWFALKFLDMPNSKTYLAVSNVESSITILELPDNARSKIRLKAQNREVKSKRNESLTHPTHNALIFNIEFDSATKILISSSLDGNHILWSAKHAADSTAPLEIQQKFLIPAMSNNARTHMLRHSPIKEDLFCTALGKAGVRFYSIPENLVNCKFDMSPNCSLIARKIAKANVSPTSVAWHPNHEYRLAIGTLEGKIFRVDLTPRKANLVEALLIDSSEKHIASNPVDDALEVDYQPVGRSHADKQTNRPKTDGVYSICWGPNPACPQDPSKHAIYVIGSISHRLFIYYSNKDSDKLTNYLDEFQDKSLPESHASASEVSWKSSMDLMALGTTDGRVIIVTFLDESHQERSKNKLFKHLVTIQGALGSSYIQCLAWHPTTDKEDANYYKIAASSNESPAFVFNLKEAVLVADVKERLRLEQANGDSSNSSVQVNLLGSYVNKLKAHEKAITDIVWNPHEPNQLATCSFDKTCYVWNLDGSLLDSRVIAKFSARDRLFTLDWSLTDPNLVYTSGHDSVIWAWRPTENPHHLVSV